MYTNKELYDMDGSSIKELKSLGYEIIAKKQKELDKVISDILDEKYKQWVAIYSLSLTFIQFLLYNIISLYYYFKL